MESRGSSNGQQQVTYLNKIKRSNLMLEPLSLNFSSDQTSFLLGKLKADEKQ